MVCDTAHLQLVSAPIADRHLDASVFRPLMDFLFLLLLLPSILTLSTLALHHIRLAA
jgi:hypothetical protein